MKLSIGSLLLLRARKRPCAVAADADLTIKSMLKQLSDRYTPSARLLRNVPEQADVFPDGALGRTARASIICSSDNLAGRAQPGKASSFPDAQHSG